MAGEENATQQTVESAQNLAAALKDVETASYKSSLAMGAYDSVVSKSSIILGKLSSGLDSFTNSLNKSGNMATASAAQFTLLADGVITVQKSFEGLGGIDSSGLTTFGDQIKYVQETLLTGNLADGVKKMAEIAIKAGASASVVAEAVAKGGKMAISVLGKLIENQTMSADNALRLSTAYIHNMTATGNMSKLYEQAGGDLGNLNVVMDKQANMLGNVSKATGKLPPEVNKAFSAYMQIPGAIDSVIDVAGIAGEKLNGLTAIMKLADGTGRNFADVNTDVSKAIKSFTGTIEDSQKHMGSAMEFTQRFTELSNKLHISTVDVRDGLGAATEALMKYTNAGSDAFRMTQGVQNITAQYAEGLIKSGMTGKQATEAIANMTNAFGSLNTAQKAFLSAQTGGPGGLMGAAQIEKMVLSGDIEGIQKKVMEVMRKQIGTMVTQDEAGKSEAAGQQFVRQKLLLQQGPLGQLAKSDKDAAQMSDMLTRQQRGEKSTVSLGDSKLGLSEAIARGSKWEEKTHGAVADIAADVNAIAMAIQSSNLNLTQRTHGTISTGADLTAGVNAALQSEQRRRGEGVNRAMTIGGTNAANVNNSSGPSSNETAANMKNVADQAIKTLKDLPKDAAQAATQQAKMVKDAVQGSPKPQDPRSTLRPAQTLVAPGAMPSLDIKNQNFGTTNPGAMVGTARRAPTPPRAPSGSVPSPTVTVEEAGSSRKFNVKVKVEVDDKEVSAQARAQGPAGGDSP